MDTWDAMQAAEVARLHLREGLSLTEIARRFDISRFRAGRLLGAAREAGWVRVDIDPPQGIDVGLSREFAEWCRRFGVRRALVTPAAGGRPALERATADAVENSAQRDDVIGFACGTTVNRVIAAIRGLPPCEVVQLTGLTAPGNVADSSVETIRRAARLTGTQVRPVYEPMVQPSVAAATERRSHPSLVRAFARWERLTTALITMGAWVEGESNLYDSPTLDEATRHRGRRAGAVAEFCGHLIDADGRIVAPEISARCLTIPIRELEAAREIIAVAARPERARAVRATLERGSIHTLVAIEGTARALMGDLDS